MKKFIPILLASMLAIVGALTLTRSTTAQVGGSGTVVFTDICLDYYYIARHRGTGEEVSGNVWPVMADGTMGEVARTVSAGRWDYELYRQDGLVERGDFVLGNGQTVNIWSSQHNCPVARSGNLTVASSVLNGAAEVAANPSRTYTIVQGDTIESIALKLGVEVRILLIHNPWLVIPMTLVPGDTVNVPNQTDIAVSAAQQAVAAGAGAGAGAGAVAAVAPAQAAAPAGPSSLQAVGSASGGGQIAIRNNAGSGECGQGSINGQFQEVLTRLSGTLRYDDIRLYEVGTDINGDICVTISTRFFGGNGQYTLFVNGTQVAYRGPHLESRLDGEYGFMRFDLISECNQTISFTLELVSGDGQRISQVFSTFVPCPGSADANALTQAIVDEAAAAAAAAAALISVPTGPSALQAVGNSSNGSTMYVRNNARSGECGTASRAGIFQDVVNRLQGIIRLESLAVKSVAIDSNQENCVTFGAVVFGGSSSYTFFINGVQVGHRGPNLISRADGDYGAFEFDLVAECNQQLTFTLTIQSGDGQTITHTFNEFVSCTTQAVAPAPVTFVPTPAAAAPVASQASQTVVGAGSGGGQIVVIDNAAAGECGAGFNSGEVVPKVSGGMRVEEITLREVAHFRRTQVCVTFDLLFFGGQGPHSIFVNGTPIDHRGPHLVSRLDGEFGYLAYDLIVDCNQTYDMNVTLGSSDAQTAQGRFSQFIPCP